MIEKVVTWAIAKVVEEEIDDSVVTGALLGAALDTAAFTAIGVTGPAAVVGGAITGASLNVIRKVRKGHEE